MGEKWTAKENGTKLNHFYSKSDIKQECESAITRGNKLKTTRPLIKKNPNSFEFQNKDLECLFGFFFN